jgi:hypothetical protein
MSEKSEWEAIPIGLEIGPAELVLDKDLVNERAELVQWKARELIDELGIVPPGMTIVQHPRMRFVQFSSLRAAIWAKSEHEFLKPKKIGSKVIIKGKIVDKYVKRGKNYIVTDFETIDEDGDVVLRSRETAIHLD